VWQQHTREVLQPAAHIGLLTTQRATFGLVRFRSPLLTESLRFPFLPVLRCFSSRAYLLTPYEFRCGSPGITLVGLPHSDIHGSKPVGGSPWLFAASYVLLRLLVPRHPPCALNSSASQSLNPPSHQDHVQCSRLACLHQTRYRLAHLHYFAFVNVPGSSPVVGRRVLVDTASDHNRPTLLWA
jgi:hypothetical protein